MKTSEVVLDASALLALLRAEAEAARVEAAVDRAVIGAVNLSEVVAKLAGDGAPLAAIREAVGSIDLEVHGFDAELAFRAGALRPATRRLGLSFGDRACLALAEVLGAPVMTADRAWAEVDLGVPIEVIR